MSTLVSAHIGKDHYRTTLSGGQHTIHADEPSDLGGTDTGMSPHQLLAAALGSCTCITVRMYADRKAWPLESIEATVHIDHGATPDTTTFTRRIQFNGPLDADQRRRLLQIAERCPIHRALKGEISMVTEVVEE